MISHFTFGIEFKKSAQNIKISSFFDKTGFNGLDQMVKIVKIKTVQISPSNHNFPSINHACQLIL